MSYATDATKIKVGAGKIWIDNGSGYRAIGYTLGNIDINVIPTFRDRKTSQTGITPMDKVLIGQSATIEFKILEDTNDNLLLAIPMASVYTGSGETLGLGGQLYSSLLDKAVKVKFHPINQLGADGADDETVLTDDWIFWQCANAESAAFSFTDGESEDKNYAVKMTVFPDTTKAANYCLGVKGDPANTTLDVTPPALDDSGTKGVAVLKSASRTRITSGSALTGCDTPTDILVTMNETLDAGSAINPGNFLYVDEAAPDTPITITTLALDATAKIITLTVPAQTTGHTYRISFNGLKDLAGNTQIVGVTRSFTIA